jgi:hypothetical protein
MLSEAFSHGLTHFRIGILRGKNPSISVPPLTLRKCPKFRTICPPATRHLSDEQRQRYTHFAAAPSPDQLARYFHLDRGDWEVTDGLRGDHNRFGFALMLGSARFLGVVPGADLEIPGSVTAFLVSQLDLKEEPSLKGYFDHNNGQRIRHLALIRERMAFRNLATMDLPGFA